MSLKKYIYQTLKHQFQASNCSEDNFAQTQEQKMKFKLCCISLWVSTWILEPMP